MASPASDFGAAPSPGSSSPASDFGAGTHPTSRPTHHGGGGVLHWLGHEANTGLNDLEGAAINTIPGTYKLAKDTLGTGSFSKGLASAGQAWKDLLLHGNLHYAPGDPLKQDVQGIVQSTKETVRHPLRHPGNTLLLALPAVSGAAKFGIATGEGATGAEAGAFAARTLRTGDLAVHPEASRTGLGQVATRASDALIQRRAATHPGGRAENLLHRKVNKTLTAERQQAERAAKAAPGALIRLGRKLKPGEQKALQVVAEQTPLDRLITTASARVTGAKTELSRRGHQEDLAALHAAEPHLTVGGDGLPKLVSPRLQAIYDKMAAVAGDRETLAKNLNLLTDEAAQGRKTSAGRVALGAHYVTAEEARAAANKAGAAGHAAERMIAKQGGEAERTAARLTSRLEKQTASAESKAFAAGTTRTAAERDALTAAAKTSREAARASSQRFAHAPRAAEGENVAGLLQREQRLAQIAWDRFQRGEIGPGVLARSQRRLAKLNDRWENLAPSTLTMRNARNVGDAAAREQEAQITKLRAAEEQATKAHQTAQANAAALRISAKGAAYIRGAVARVNDAKLAAARAATERAMAEELARSNRIIGGEDFTASPTAVRIPDVATRKGTRALGRPGGMGTQGTIGHPRAPGSLTHEYTGYLRELGLRRQDTTTLVGESGLEVAKYAGLKHLRDLAKQAARPVPTRPDDVAIRLDKSQPLPREVLKFLSDPQELLNATPAEKQSIFEQARSHLFINPKTLDPTSAAEFQRLHAEGKIGWVPKKILGEIGQAHAPLRALGGGAAKGVAAADAINNAQRFAILYLKPAYAIPNVLGNAALALVQQGFAAPRNLAQAARIVQRLADEDYARIDANMGEGVARAISAHGEGRMSGTIDKAAGLWSRAVDQPFRRSSFIHEARRAGFKTPAQIHELLTRDVHDPQLTAVSIRANRDMIDYANLGPTEREIIRRTIFFYPWVKGSTVYAGRFLREHPLAAAAVGASGQLGQKYSQQAFGPTPSYLEGLIPFGSNRAFNPSSAAILQTPAQVGEAAQGLLSGNISSAANVANFYTPAVSLALAEAERRDPGTGFAYRKGHRGFGQIAADQLGGGLPQVSLAKNLAAAVSGHGGSKLYPPSVEGALGQFLLGGVYPRKINRQRLNDLARSEQSRIQNPH